jgi:hypothetical protein
MFDRKMKNRDILLEQNKEFEMWSKNVLLNSNGKERRNTFLTFPTH